MSQITAKPVLIYGAGGFAREVAWLIDSSSSSPWVMDGFIDDSTSRAPAMADTRPVFNYIDARKQHPHAGVVIAIANSAVRHTIGGKLDGDEVDQPVVVHSSVLLSERVRLGRGSVICAGSQLTVDIDIGVSVHINLNCTIGHDVVVGDFSTLSPGVHVSGCVSIGKGVFIGTGATILNGSMDKPLTLGDGCVIAAGACVTKSTEPHTLYAGVPAVAKKRLNT